jgi:hypothetical protein
MKAADVARDARWPRTRPDAWCGEHPLRQRDRLAAMAMRGGMSSGHEVVRPGDFARYCYEIADAMLAAASAPSRENDRETNR